MKNLYSVIKACDRVYLFELKLVALVGTGSPLHQLKEKKYHEKYAGKDIYLPGIEFSLEDRNVFNFEWEFLPTF